MMKKEKSDLASKNYFRDKNGKAVFAEDGRKKGWKKQMKTIMNEEKP